MANNRGGLSKREYDAKKSGGTLNYKTGAITKPIALPRVFASKTPAMKLMQAQKSQPIRLTGIPLPKPAVPSPEVSIAKNARTVEEMTNPASAFNARQKSLSFKKTLDQANENVRKAKEEEENAKANTGIKGFVKNLPGVKAVRESIQQKSFVPLATQFGKSGPKYVPSPETYKKLAGKDPSEEYKKDYEESTASDTFNIPFSGGGFVGAVKNVAKKEGSSIFKRVAEKTKGLFSSIGKNTEKNGRLRSGITDLAEQQRIAAANRARVAESMRTPRALASENADDALKTLSKTDGTPPSSNVRNVRFNEPKIGTPEFSPRTPNATGTVGKIAREETPRNIPRGRAELPKRNTNKTEDLFEEPDDLGRSKVFTNVDDGSGKLKRVEVGEFDEAGNFKERLAEDGRPMSDVIDEGNRNLRSGRRGATRMDTLGDSRAVLRRFEGSRKRAGAPAFNRSSDMKSRVKRDNGRYAGSVKREVAEGVEKTESKKGLLRRAFEARQKERAYLKQRDENIMLAIEEALPKLEQGDGNIARGIYRLDEADRLKDTMRKLAGNRKIGERERADTMETLARLGVGTNTHYATGAVGAGAGFERDENGNIRYDAEKGLAGLALGIGGLKAMDSGGGLLRKARLKKLTEQRLKAEGAVAGRAMTPTKQAITKIPESARAPEIPGTLAKGDGFPPRQTPATGRQKTVLSPPTVQNPRVSPSWVSEKATSIREYIQDNWIRVKNLIKETGTEVNAKDLTPYQAETLMHGRIQSRLTEANDTVKAIDKTIADAEKALKNPNLRKDIDQYLIAKHAPERNARLGDGAAGMSNEEARSIVSAVEAGENSKQIREIAGKIKELNHKTLDILRDGGVIDDETYKLLRETYKEHVPLQRVFEDMEDMGGALTGRGLDVRGSGILRAKGSEREVADILTNVAANVEQAIVRAEKNRVDLATLQFAREHKDLGVFEELAPKVIGKTSDGRPIFDRITDPNVLTLMENGKPVHIRIKDERLAQAFKAVGNTKLDPLLKFVGSFTRLYSGLATRFNPEFTFSNKLRDLQEMVAYMGAQKGIGFGGAAKTVARDTVSMADVAAGVLGKDTDGARLYRQMVNDGGTTGGMSLSTRQQLEIDIDSIRRMNRGGIFNARNAGKKFLSAIDSWNQVFEDSTRLSVYKTALDKGMSRDQAAYLAKNATINFNKKGTGGTLINSLWMFSNASIQGTAKLASAMKNPKVAGAVVSTVGASTWAVNSWNDRVDPEWRDKVETWDRQKNLVVVLPTDSGTRYVTLPVSWGIAPIKTMADYAYDLSNGKAKEGDAFDVASGTLGALWNSYNPLGGNNAFSTAMPTIGDVPTEIYTNTKWSGSNIHPDDKEGVSDFENYFKNKDGVPSDKSKLFGALRSGTKKLNEMTGGKIDINPANLKYAIEQYISGTGRAVSGVAETASSLIEKGEFAQPNDTPFMRRFFKKKSEEELEKSQKFERKLTLQEELKKIPREEQPKKIQEYLNSIEDENQRKGAAYGLSQEGFNTKGTSSSEKIIKGRPIYEKIQALYDEGRDDEGDTLYNDLNEEETEWYDAVRTSERSKETEKLHELLETDPKKAVEYVRSLRSDKGDRLYENLLKTGNEDWLEKYELGKELIAR